MKGAAGVKGKQAQLITSNTRGKYISSRWPGRQQLLPLSSCADSIKEQLRDVSQTSVASEKEPILARVGFFNDSDGRSSATSSGIWSKIQTYNKVPASPSWKSKTKG